MPLINVRQLPGRTPEQKKQLIQELTETFVQVTGAKQETVWVVIEEVDSDSWGIGGLTLKEKKARAEG